jgi:hypothetical protein
MILRNCSACGQKLRVLDTKHFDECIQRDKMCSACKIVTTTYEIPKASYDLFLEARKAKRVAQIVAPLADDDDDEPEPCDEWGNPLKT